MFIHFSFPSLQLNTETAWMVRPTSCLHFSLLYFFIIEYHVRHSHFHASIWYPLILFLPHTPRPSLFFAQPLSSCFSSLDSFTSPFMSFAHMWFHGYIKTGATNERNAWSFSFWDWRNSFGVLWSLHLLRKHVSSEHAVPWPACVHFFLLVRTSN